MKLYLEPKPTKL